MEIRLAKKIPGAKILAETVTGKMLVMRHVFAHRDDPRLVATLARIRAAGAIDPTHWRPAGAGEF